MQKPLSWPLPISALWLILPVVGAVVAATLEPIPPHDYWWHLAMGRLIDLRGTIPDTNLFLYTLPADMPFLDQPWLGQWLMWSAFEAMGHAGTVLLRNLLLLASVALLLRMTFSRSRDARVTGALVLLAVVLAFPVLTVRTRMFAFLPFILVLGSTFAVADERLPPWWLVVPPLATLFWANVHGSFILSVALVLGVGGSLILQRFLENLVIDRRLTLHWGLCSVGVVVAGAMTPHGWQAYEYVFQLAISSNVATSVSEWMPPDPTTGIGVLFALSVAASIAVLAYRRSSVQLYEVVVYAGMLYLSASAIRSIFWWAAAMPLILAPHVAALVPDADQEPTSTVAGTVHAVAVGLIVAIAIFVQPGVGRETAGKWMDAGVALRRGDGAWILNHENPTMLVEKLQEDDRDQVFHDQVLGGMLEFHLTAGGGETQVAYVDQRMEFVPQKIWDRYFEVGRAQGWEEELEKWNVDTLLLNPESQWPLLQAALVSRNWSLVGVGPSHVLLYRRGSFDRAEHPAKQQHTQDEESDVDGGDDP